MVFPLLPASHSLLHTCCHRSTNRIPWKVINVSFLTTFCIDQKIYAIFVIRGILAAIDTFSDHAIVGIFYFVGFALFTLETLVSIWVLQFLDASSILCVVLSLAT
ncbi:hypothetical protein EJB05_19624 [Eragrostis curvula]|uniref:Secretory carrier-associated membrane protein n=1 Tax=Eragrostis curvula TaxID=38414 RepID=A0A5J9UWX7_9POAL|nr:hypothetical protein EJB05_19624 [Eragrostis curvula]